jgi:hypothetical protein
MKKYITTIPKKVFSTIAIIASSLLIMPAAQSAVLLQVDLSVENTITLTATEGASSATVTGSDFTGFYLADFFAPNTNGTNLLDGDLVSGDLTSFLDTSDGSPDIFRAGSGGDTGLNVWTYTDGEFSSFEIGSRAFSGSATWTTDPSNYLHALGAVGGDVFFAASSISGTANASLLGTWEIKRPDVVDVNAPASFGLAVLTLSFVLFRRTQKNKV